MADTAATSGSDAAAQRAAEQARLRKERREAKIKSGGSARLNKITGAGGRVTGDSDSAPATAPEPQPAAISPPNPFTISAATVDDPEEVDISQHHFVPRTTLRKPPAAASPAATDGPSLSDAQLRQMMLGFDRPTPSNNTGPGPSNGPGSQEEDPIMKMMSQMMGGNMPPGGGGFAGMPMPQQQAPIQAPARSVTIWRILHALFAIGLGLFFALTTPFTGSKIERERTALAFSVQQEEDQEDHQQLHRQRQQIFFWVFATAELILLSSRFFFDKASTRSTGIVGTVLSYLPQPYRGYLEVGQRYFQIFGAVRTDILTCVFVLGLCTWLQAGDYH